MPRTEAVYRASPYRWVILGLLSFSYLLVYVHRMCPAVLSEDIMNSFGASGAATGLLASAYFYPYAIMQAPGGMISDKLGPRRLVTLSMLVASLGSVLFALSGSVGTAFWSRVLVGLGVSVVLVPSYKALTAWFPAKDYVLGTSLVISIAGLGGLLAGSPLAWLSEAIGWRGSFWAIAGLTMINAFLVWFLVRDKPQDFGLPPVEPEDLENGRPLVAIPLARALGIILGSRDFWLLAGWFFFNGGILFSFAGLWAGPYYMQAYAMSKTQAGQVINLFAFGWVFGPLVFAWIAGKVASRGAVLGGSMVAWAGLTIWMLARNGAMALTEIYAWNLIFGFLGAGPAGVCFAAAKERFPLQVAGTVTGLMYVFPMAGSAIYQPLAGAILDSSGNMGAGMSGADFTPLFMFYLASIVAGGVMAYCVRPRS
ncbi:MAG: MFS transporter [Proteobacteria bacterium]|nr:MFS transporter [Pseudomonadota bacterium]MBU1452462.1 MFS transporter [Pseudomonadota bacterium]MBU2467729.1 MFS transporter [Pseudomonadota bacterium]